MSSSMLAQRGPRFRKYQLNAIARPSRCPKDALTCKKGNFSKNSGKELRKVRRIVQRFPREAD